MFNFKFIRYSLANLTYLISVLYFITILVSLYYQDGQAFIYVRQLIFLLVAAFLLKFGIKAKEVTKLRTQDLFLATSIIWIYCVIICMIPYLVIARYSFADSFFEMSSGVTSTGSSIITNFSSLPISLLFWRSLTQWLGGIGFIVVGVLILPNLGTGGMKLFKTESSDSEDKAFSHYRDMALMIMLYYLVLTFSCVIAYWLCGMNKIDAILYGLTTVSTGGFAPTDQPFNGLIDQYWPGVIFMLLSALPFQIIVANLQSLSPWKVFKDQQVRVYLITLAVVAFIISLDRLSLLTGTENGAQYNQSILMIYWESLVNLINISTSTGYTISDYSSWGAATIYFLMIMAIIGGCSGSTTGGLKMFRINILQMFIRKQMYRTIHSNSSTVLLYNGQPVDDEDFSGVVFALAMFFMTGGVGVILLCFSGLEIGQAASSVITTIANTGAIVVSPVSDSGGFDGQTDLQKIICSIIMILGRLECTTMLILLLPKFWRY